ncbi:50S ribosomal protein L6 [Polyangium jinanense]|uniref:Large ribosomal subunit protein uL6 n=1 Tax=Polyangium jinanense TaxID=2829994 RepID=A0A9X3WZM1_9BACT|nr:50S ribosomal protein L6 [Polyangium jinanense]MDC3952246.1 50S ribosomal protein L6 [Polyangium jinanense]MDC3956391.1 50S ribosomal protein L6 [Polyangium jinanense]MDC3979875.1 50S ribosomal protein L6 [Polyangium jinanense]MDC3982528.1 50S ribosomal protein L6 [Polyangium jinanense]
MQTATTQQGEASKTSRIGKRPVDVPKGVTVSVQGRKVEIKGTKGQLARELPSTVDVKVEGAKLHVTSTAPGRDGSRLQGLVRALLAGMVKGAADGYERVLELKGTGYRVDLKGTTLTFALGYSHPVVFNVPKGLTATIPADSKGTVLVLTGADKELIGQTAATIRGFRPPEPYGGKGVRYRGERVREKAGKAGGKGGKK